MCTKCIKYKAVYAAKQPLCGWFCTKSANTRRGKEVIGVCEGAGKKGDISYINNFSGHINFTVLPKG